MKSSTLKIADEFFQQLKTIGHTVPRYPSSGKTMSLRVGLAYNVTNALTGDKIMVKCCQSQPCAIKTIDDKGNYINP